MRRCGGPRAVSLADIDECRDYAACNEDLARSRRGQAQALAHGSWNVGWPHSRRDGLVERLRAGQRADAETAAFSCSGGLGGPRRHHAQQVEKGRTV